MKVHGAYSWAGPGTDCPTIHLLEGNMNTLSSLCFSFGVFALAFLPVNLGGQRSVDELHTYSGHGGDYRIDDTTRFLYGSFTISSNSGQTQISAHRLRVGLGRKDIANSFRNDLLSGHVFSDGVDIKTNALIWTDILRYSADLVEYSKDSLSITLRGHAVVQGDDVKVSSQKITVFLTEWEHLGR